MWFKKLKFITITIIIISFFVISVVSCENSTNKASDDFVENFLPPNIGVLIQIDNLESFLTEINYNAIKNELSSEIDSFDKEIVKELGIPFPSITSLEQMGFYIDKPFGFASFSSDEKVALLYGYLKNTEKI